MIRNIIFDWSGTLVDDLPAVWLASNRVFENAGVEPMTLEAFRAEFELPYKPFYDRYTPHISDEQREAWFHEHFPEVIHLVEDLPHARGFLEFCRREEIRVVLFSAIPRDQFDFLTERNGFNEFFHGHELAVKDKRERIHDLLERYELDPAETMFVGDMRHDLDAAKHGGVFACATLTGYNTLTQLRAGEPHLIVEHLGELRDIFERGELKARLTGDESNEGIARAPVATVGGLIFNDAGEALLLRTDKWSGLWGMPGGKIKYGETAEQAFIREVKEETNLEATDVKFELFLDCIEPEEFYRKAHFVLLNYTCGCRNAAETRLNDEAQEFQWLSLEAALKLPLNGPSERLIQAIAEERRINI